MGNASETTCYFVYFLTNTIPSYFLCSIPQQIQFHYNGAFDKCIVKKYSHK